MSSESPSETAIAEYGRKIASTERWIKFLSGKPGKMLLCYQLILPEREYYTRCMALLSPSLEIQVSVQWSNLIGFLHLHFINLPVKP